MEQSVDILVVGAGGAGLMAAIFGSAGRRRVALVEGASEIGGTLHIAGGHMSAAGTRLQHSRGISDDPQRHFEEVMHISRGTADPDAVWRAVSNAADTVDWLVDRGLDICPDHPVIYRGHDPYLVPRTYWGMDGGMSLLRVLDAELRKSIARGAVQLRRATKLKALSREGKRWVAVLAAAAGQQELIAESVVLATGGFAGNAEMLARYCGGHRPVPVGNAGSQGDGLAIALSLGGQIVNIDKFLAVYGAVRDPRQPARETSLTILMPHLRQPWEIYVDGAGRRFVGEDDVRVEARDEALLRLPDLTFWVVWDAQIEAQAPSLFRHIDPADVAHAWNSAPGFVSAEDLPNLAVRAAMDPTLLAQTVGNYNTAVALQSDSFGRRHLPARLERPPFRAVRHRGTAGLSFAGLKVDSVARVIGSNGQPIAGLYAAGEILGHGLFNGKGFAGGMAITPALTYGRLIGQALST